MTTLRPAARKNRNRTTLLLILGAAGVVLFVCASAVIFYRNTQHLLASHGLEEHSQQILSLLQTESARLERMDYLSRVYLAERNNADRNSVETTETVVDSGLSELEKLIWDNKQRDRARAAHLCTNDLTRQLEALLASGEAGAVEKANLTRKMLECRDLISHMEVAEGLLLKMRTSDAQHSAFRSLIAGGAFLCLSLLAVLGLFGLLLRDVLRQIAAEAQIFNTNERLKEKVQQLKSQAAEAHLITSLRQELLLCTTPGEAYKTTVRHVAKAMPTAEIALMAFNSEQKILETGATSDEQTQILDGFPINACCGLRAGRSRRRQEGESEIECGHFVGEPPRDYLCVPLTAHGEAVGLLYFGYPEGSNREEIDLHQGLMERVAELASMWIASLNLRAQLEEQSIRDGLTNLFNRRFMEIALERELRLAARRKSDLSVLMLDIDHFKCFNDTFGHEAGDQVLRGAADVVREAIRAEDIACRYGGEEILVILPAASSETARQRAEEIRRRVGEMRLELGKEKPATVTVSIGVATYPQGGQTPEELVRSADQALYTAKESGRNRVVVFESAIAV